MRTETKNKIGKILEVISGRRCERCRYNSFIFCKRDDAKGKKCREKIYPYGYEKKKEYDKELMNQYIELTYPLGLQGTVTEEEKAIIADTLGFGLYCIDMEVEQLKKEIRKSLEPIRKKLGAWKHDENN